jgi:hypothetical protein
MLIIEDFSSRILISPEDPVQISSEVRVLRGPNGIIRFVREGKTMHKDLLQALTKMKKGRKTRLARDAKPACSCY